MVTPVNRDNLDCLDQLEMDSKVQLVSQDLLEILGTLVSKVILDRRDNKDQQDLKAIREKMDHLEIQEL